MILNQLYTAGLQANIKKFKFCVTYTKYLGFVITTKGIEIDPEKSKPLCNQQFSTIVQEVRGFLGFTGFYRKFILNYSVLTRLLYHLTKDNTPFQFNKEC